MPKRHSLWLNTRDSIIFPAECPGCLEAPCHGSIELSDAVTGSVRYSWPHCGACMEAHRKRHRPRKVLGRATAAGLGLFLLFVGAQFLGTGVPDDTLLTTGMWSCLAVVGFGLVLAFEFTPRNRQRLERRRPGSGVAMGRFVWEGVDPFPPLSQPFYVAFSFIHRAYRDAFLLLNLHAAAETLEGAKDKIKLFNPPGQPMSSEEHFKRQVNSHVDQARRDKSSLSWTMGVDGVIGAAGVLVLSVIISLALGKTRPGSFVDENRGITYVAAGLLTLLAVTLLLRINAARILLAGLILAGALIGAAVVVAQFETFGQFAAEWKRNLSPLGLGMAGGALLSPTARRMCSRWGRLEPWIQRLRR